MQRQAEKIKALGPEASEEQIAQVDEWGKLYFENLPFKLEEDGDDFYHVGFITPVIHYCMGGLEITTKAEVMSKEGTVIPGLYAAGEVMGGVHGESPRRLVATRLRRLRPRGGASACVPPRTSRPAARASRHRSWRRARALSIHVDVNRLCPINIAGKGGTSVAPSAPVVRGKPPKQAADKAAAPSSDADAADSSREVPLGELAEHANEEDVWVVLHGKVYDVTGFLPDHPGGKRAIMLYAGKDASEEFDMLHPPAIKDSIAKYLGAKALKGVAPKPAAANTGAAGVAAEELARQPGGSVWVLLNREVYDVTEFLDKHPGGKNVIMLRQQRRVGGLQPFAPAGCSNSIQKYLGDKAFKGVVPERVSARCPLCRRTEKSRLRKAVGWPGGPWRSRASDVQ